MRLLVVFLCLGVAIAAQDEVIFMSPVSQHSRFERVPQFYEPRFQEVDPLVTGVAGAPAPQVMEETPEAGFQLHPGASFQPGNYYPPTQPYRFPSFPYDNPTYSAMPQVYPVPLPPPWRSDALNVFSDGGRYMQDMSHYDYYQ